MASICLVPLLLFRKIPLVNGVIADAPQHVNFSNKIYQRVRLTSPFSAVFVSNSKAGLSAYRIPAKKSVCIYNGIDFNRFLDLPPRGEIEKEFWPQGKKDRFIIAMVAAFEKRKDYHTLIQAAILLCESSSQVVFLLIGDGQDLPAIKNEIPAALKGTRIIFTGKRNDIESLLRITDVGVLLTNSAVHGEGISNSIIEYMASRKPVIATRGGGTDEVVQDGVNGFLVEPKNPRQLVEKLNLLIRDPGLCRKLGDAGFTFVHENFDAIKAKQKYEDLYRRLIG
jgi:glycosyltransferase involved in cell wall biosynthesis